MSLRSRLLFLVGILYELEGRHDGVKFRAVRTVAPINQAKVYLRLAEQEATMREARGVRVDARNCVCNNLKECNGFW